MFDNRSLLFPAITLNIINSFAYPTHRPFQPLLLYRIIEQQFACDPINGDYYDGIKQLLHSISNGGAPTTTLEQPLFICLLR